MSIGIPRIYFGTARVRGASGDIVWQTGQIDDLTRLAVGVFDFELSESLSPLSAFGVLSFLSDAPASSLTFEIAYPSQFHVVVRTFANGAPYDADFFIDLYNMRVAQTGELEPPPSPPPPPPPVPPAAATNFRSIFLLMGG